MDCCVLTEKLKHILEGIIELNQTFFLLFFPCHFLLHPLSLFLFNAKREVSLLETTANAWTVSNRVPMSLWLAKAENNCELGHQEIAQSSNVLHSAAEVTRGNLSRLGYDFSVSTDMQS